MFCSVFASIILLKYIGVLGWSTSASVVNEPTLEKGSLFFYSSFKKVSRGNYVLYVDHVTDSMTKLGLNNNIYVQRVCGIPGDIIEMKNGTLYVNGENFDKDFKLKAFYRIDKSDYENSHFNFDSLASEADNNIIPATDKFVLANLNDDEVKALTKEISIKRFNPERTDDIFTWLPEKNNYSLDNFGSLTIPPDHYFVLGDNRHNVLDSRFTGYISKSNIKGVVLFKR